MSTFSILVVDDEFCNFEIIEDFLNTANLKTASSIISTPQNSHDYQLHYAKSGVEAISSLNAISPDLILLDVMMPEMDGIELCQKIKAIPQWESVPIIMVTALRSKKNLAQCLSAGADDFISKPVNRLELSARVRSMLRTRELYIQLEDLVKLRTSQLLSATYSCKHHIKERLHAELALYHTESQFRAMIENASDMIFLLDTQHLVNYASPSVKQNLGFITEKFTELPLTTWIHSDDQIKFSRLLENSLTNPEQPHTTTIRWQHLNGDWRVFETISQYFKDATGFSGIVINARDITDRLQAEAMEQSLKQEKELSELKLNFFSMASHEFRTPLSVIIMAAQILENAEIGTKNTKRLKNIRRIHSSASDLRRMLKNTLEFARLEARPIVSKPKSVCLRTLCKQVLDSLQSSFDSKPRIHHSYHGLDMKVSLDPELVNTILTNLLSNAIKYSKPDQPIQFLVTQQPEQVEFMISDKGIGIPSKDQSQLFETFYRGDNVGRIEGSGLGLAIVKKCVDLHDGQISFVSVENQSTTFSVKIPTHQPSRS